MFPAFWTMHTSMFTASNGDRMDAQNLCLVITDGVSAADLTRLASEAVKIRQEGITLMTVHVGNQVCIPLVGT